ncbi:MAG: hypothetical protein AB1600_06155 [Bacteroidota bacterium]
MPNINRQLLREALPKFHEFMQTEDGQTWKAERDRKDTFFRTYFSEREIANLEEGTLREMIHILWAWNSWTNKDYLLERMLSSGLPTIREAFKKLLFGQEGLAERFNHVKQNVNMMGAASISEILAHHDHEQYPIWTRRSRAGLSALGVSEDHIPRSTQISGNQYEEFCNLVREVRQETAAESPEFTDLFTLDYFLYFISTQVSAPARTGPVTQVVAPVAVEDFDHDEVIDQVLELGDGLGFEVQKEFSVARGCRIDAIWRSRIANLGTIAYAFEVHRRGSRDSAILNLQRIRRDPTIQKVILVASRQELDQFKEEITTLDEGFRNSVGYFEVQSLQTALDHLQSLKAIMKSIGLLNVESLFDHT